MAQNTPVINILTYKLPFELSNQIYNEYQSRMKDAVYLIDNYKTYMPLNENKKTVELFISLSIFHRRVISNLDGAVKFYGTVTRTAQTDTIRIGNYNLNGAEKNKLLAVVINYQNLLERFSIPPQLMEYYETRELLKNLIALKSNFDNADSQKKGRSKGSQGNEEDIPF